MAAATNPRPVTAIDALGQAERTALEWIDTVADTVGTPDQGFAYRLLRAWLHAVRDRLEVDGAAHLGAQLPLLLRGIWYDGWRPSVVPVKFGPEQLVSRVSAEAGVDPVEARRVIPLVTAALDRRWAPGQTDHLLTQLPASLRELVAPDAGAPGSRTRSGRPVTSAPDDDAPAPTPPAGSPERIGTLERTVARLVDALSELVRAIEAAPANDAAAHVPRAYRVLTPQPSEPGKAFSRNVVDAAHHARTLLAGLGEPGAEVPRARAPGP
ncbi:MAG: DUF2267 domain-containing protein [Pseudonocardia sp.]|uniref:DUF2267 domain-containing protein n=1 Tax=unclassified Pseudonocardia TaxID=2619320 RepID=UPI00086A38B6|nr:MULTISPECIES: DUF2267 domain-containing protein [unclassified Pseudonocardia]MBN9110753.1 DUF2267 domain-containing protein [Pseudonocardia sp.]ODU27127.1 MAG: hypothetical protein ABS80_04620 [Pseudonocardia sp. SCN 72-51]ODV04450.1 MAG: hypothetical protein ABT15_21010 [Pseudonocardia sp. SCN 73-27]